MKWIFLLYLTFLVVADGEVLSLTDDNFEETIKGDKPVFVKFFAPWCGHCKALAPDYIKLAEEVKSSGFPVIIAEVDATVSGKIASKYEVHGYPTLKLFIEGNPINYEKERKVNAMLEFIKKKMQPSSIEITDIEKLKEKAEGNGRRCILVTSNPEELQQYMNTGRMVDEFEFYHTSEELGKQYFTELSKSAMILLRDFGEKKKVYGGPYGPKELELYLKEHQFDLVSDLNDESAKLVFSKAEKKGVLLITYDNVPEEAYKVFREFAEKKASKKYMFLISKNSDDWGKRYTDFFKIQEEETPLVEIIEGSGKMSRYRHDGKIVLEQLISFIDKFEAGKLEKYIKSEPVPEDNAGPVYKVVAKTFENEVIKNDLDVMVKFYAPWCGHCKSLAPIYESVAKILKHNKKLKLVEVDATSNDIENVNINSYPTIFLYQAKKKKTPLKFEGDRTEEGIIKYLVANCTNTITRTENESKDDL